MSSPHDAAACATRLSFFLLLTAAQHSGHRRKIQHQIEQIDASAHPCRRRPRIGLALSGGGALGLAEIGVIQWLEQNHIPVDRVAGTSMGSIIAAMYATGMSPAEIQKFAEGR